MAAPGTYLCLCDNFLLLSIVEEKYILHLCPKKIVQKSYKDVFPETRPIDKPDGGRYLVQFIDLFQYNLAIAQLNHFRINWYLTCCFKLC